MPVPQSHQAPRRRTLRREAEEAIRDAIYTGVLKPGEPLGDRDLQTWLGFSRTPIREALNDLERVGLIEMSPQRYTRVFVPHSEDRLDLLHSLGALMSGVARLTVPSIEADDREALISTLHELLDAVEHRDRRRFDKTSRDTLEHFLAACPNTILLEGTHDFVSGLLYRLSVIRDAAHVDWSRVGTTVSRLIQAVREADGVAAELAVGTMFRMPEPPAIEPILPDWTTGTRPAQHAEH